MNVTVTLLMRSRAVLAVFIALGIRTAGAASPPCDERDGIALEVASELGDEADDTAMRTYLEDRLPERLEALGLCADQHAARRVVVTVAWSNAARGDYAIALRAVAPEEEPFEPGAVDCPGCATAEVLDTVAGQVPVAIAGLSEPAPATASDARPPSGSVAPTVAPARDRDRGHERPGRLGRLGRAGIGVAATGVAGIVTGAALWAEHSVVHPADSAYRLVLAPAGITLVVTGVLATAAGGTMIGLDHGRARRHRAALQPSFGPAHAGVVISGSF